MVGSRGPERDPSGAQHPAPAASSARRCRGHGVRHAFRGQGYPAGGPGGCRSPVRLPGERSPAAEFSVADRSCADRGGSSAGPSPSPPRDAAGGSPHAATCRAPGRRRSTRSDEPTPGHISERWLLAQCEPAGRSCPRSGGGRPSSGLDPASPHPARRRLRVGEGLVGRRPAATLGPRRRSRSVWSDRLRPLYRDAAASYPAGLRQPRHGGVPGSPHHDRRVHRTARRTRIPHPVRRHRPAGLPAGLIRCPLLADASGPSAGKERIVDGQPGADIKIRLVKGANLAMEKMEAEVHGWSQAPYAHARPRSMPTTNDASTGCCTPSGCRR